MTGFERIKELVDVKSFFCRIRHYIKDSRSKSRFRMAVLSGSIKRIK